MTKIDGFIIISYLVGGIAGLLMQFGPHIGVPFALFGYVFICWAKERWA